MSQIYENSDFARGRKAFDKIVSRAESSESGWTIREKTDNLLIVELGHTNKLYRYECEEPVEED